MSKVFTFPAFFLDETLVTSICGKVLTTTDCIRIDVGSLALIVTRKFGLPATTKKKKSGAGADTVGRFRDIFFFLVTYILYTCKKYVCIRERVALHCIFIIIKVNDS